jgi:acetate kinase
MSAPNVTVLGGLDALVFTAGIGENSVPVREALCRSRSLAWRRTTRPMPPADGPPISAPDSRVSVLGIPTNEELMIAQHTLAQVKE